MTTKKPTSTTKPKAKPIASRCEPDRHRTHNMRAVRTHDRFSAIRKTIRQIVANIKQIRAMRQQGKSAEKLITQTAELFSDLGRRMATAGDSSDDMVTLEKEMRKVVDLLKSEGFI